MGSRALEALSRTAEILGSHGGSADKIQTVLEEARLEEAKRESRTIETLYRSRTTGSGSEAWLSC